MATIKHDYATCSNMAKSKPEAEPDWDLAGEMCSLSIQVYELEEAMNLDQYGYHLHEFIEDETVGTQCIIAISHEGRLAISFRGTSDFTDALTDALAVKKRWIHGKGWLFFSPRVHFGFLNAYLPVRDRILKSIKELSKKNRRRVHITGHSLGGALATLCAADIRRTLKLPVTMYNYGSPRVGNRKFEKFYNKLVPDTYRFVNDKDAVPTIPKINYHHVGNLCYMDNDGEIKVNPGLATRLFDSIQDSIGFLDFEKLTDHLSSHYRDQLLPFTDKVKPLYGEFKDTVAEVVEKVEETVEEASETVAEVKKKVGKYV